MLVRALVGCAFLSAVPADRVFAQDGEQGSAIENAAPNTDTASLDLSRWLHGGSLCVGLLGGQQPNTRYNGALNYVVAGSVGLDVLGLPVEVSADHASLVPLYGRRTNLRVRMDTDRLRRKDQLAQQAQLAELDGRIDSLNTELDALGRARLGAERRLALLEQRLADQVQVPAAPTTPDSLNMSVPPTPDVGLDSIASAPQVTPPATQLNTDSLEQEATELRARLQGLEEKMTLAKNAATELEMARQRAAALGQVEGPSAFANRHAVNLRKLELGDCNGGNSEFLINGISFQGASVELGGEPWSVSVDHGRSFDDRWRNTQLADERVRELQRLFLLEGPEGSNPRKLSSIVGGYRDKTGWTVGLGLLNASRADVPLGVTIPEGMNLPKHRNQVVELTLGRSFGPNHHAKVVVARSADVYVEPYEEIPVASEDNALDQLTSGKQDNWASLLTWSSELPRSRTRLGATGKLIGRQFQSLGMSFVRADSRAGSVSVDQGLGKALRVRLNGAYEERGTTTAVMPMTILRLRSSFTLRVGRSLRIKGSALPQNVHSYTTEGGERISRQLMTSAGFDVDVLRGRTPLSMDAEVVNYRMDQPERTVNTILVRGGLRLRTRPGGQATLRLNLLPATDTIPATTDLSGSGIMPLGERTKVQFNGTLPLQAPTQASWMLGTQRMVSPRITLSVSVGKVGRPDIYFDDLNGNEESGGYTCEVRMCYAW